MLAKLAADRHSASLIATTITLEVKEGECDRLRACYQHACLRYISNEQMTNSSLLGRFGIDNSRISQIIKATQEAGLIEPYDPDNESRKHAKYVPFWA